MSAFIVEDKTINQIVSYLNWGREISERDRALSLAAKHADGTLAGLGGALFAMNVQAVDQRYGTNEHRSFREPWANYRYQDEIPGGAIQTYKALTCYLYQCSEGNVPETELFKDIERAANTLAHSIVCRLPEYDRAPWG